MNMINFNFFLCFAVVLFFCWFLYSLCLVLYFGCDIPKHEVGVKCFVCSLTVSGTRAIVIVNIELRPHQLLLCVWVFVVHHHHHHRHHRRNFAIVICCWRGRVTIRSSCVFRFILFFTVFAPRILFCHFCISGEEFWRIFAQRKYREIVN